MPRESTFVRMITDDPRTGGGFVTLPQSPPLEEGEEPLPGLNVPYDPPRSCPRCQSSIIWEESYRRNNTRCEFCSRDRACVECGVRITDYEPEDEHICATCATAVRILQWNAPANTRLLSDYRGKTYGWELELVVPRRAWKEVAEVLSSIIPTTGVVKHDGSIMRGIAPQAQKKLGREPVPFEIVTRPFHWRWWLENKDRFYKVFEKLIKLGAISHQADSCGLHVHIGGLTAPQRLGFLHMTLSQPELNLLVSRRVSTPYCFFTTLSWKDLSFYASHAGEYNRHSAAHYSHHGTMESRFFRGTLNSRSFQATLEYHRALVLFCVKRTITENTTDEEFLEYINTLKDSPTLLEYLHKRGIS
jgi:hypothetical protein